MAQPDDSTPTIAVDFDGVIHSYTSGWHGTTTIADPPVPGAVEWLTAAVLRFRVIIHTSRLAFDPSEEYHEDTAIDERIRAIGDWMVEQGVPTTVVNALRWHTGPGKPHAHIYIDDRGYRFGGTFPPLDSLAGMVPWNRQPARGERIILAEEDVARDRATGFPTLILTRINEAPRHFMLTPAAARKVAGLLVAAADEHDAEMEAVKDARLVSVVRRF